MQASQPYTLPFKGLQCLIFYLKMSNNTDNSLPEARSGSLESRQIKELTAAQVKDRQRIKDLERDLERAKADLAEAKAEVRGVEESPLERHGEPETVRHPKGAGVADSMKVCRLELELEETQEQLEYHITQNTALAEQNTALKERESGLQNRLVEAENRNRVLEGQLTDMSTRYEGLKQLLVKFQRDIHAELSQQEIESNAKVNRPAKAAPVAASSPAAAQPASKPFLLGVPPSQLPSSTAPFAARGTPSTATASGTPSVSRTAPTDPAATTKMRGITEGPYFYPEVNNEDMQRSPRYVQALHLAQLFGRAPPALPPWKVAAAGSPATTTPKSALE